MRSRSTAAQHDAAVARRLELLTTELAEVQRSEQGVGTQVRRAESWRPQGHTRIRSVPDLDDGEAADEPAGSGRATGPAPSAVRLPGRHVAHRGAVSWVRALPDGLRGRVGFGPGQVAVVAILVAVCLALTCWWLVRSGDHTLPAPSALGTSSGSLATLDGADPSGSLAGATPGAAMPSAPAASVSTSSATKVVVDVTGKVRRPGIAVLRQGARVVDALRAAGGVRSGTDLSDLNLARVLTDGEQVVVGVEATPSAAPTAAGAPPISGLVNLNTADETTLESLPDVGPVTAAAIISWRTQHGSFTSTNQLLDVDGIGEATLAKLGPLVTI
jgi:competence protein ComEA